MKPPKPVMELGFCEGGLKQKNARGNLEAMPTFTLITPIRDHKLMAYSESEYSLLHSRAA